MLLRPDVIAETEDWVALNKPSGLLTLPDRHDAGLDSLRGWLEHKYGSIYTVHRLDRDTSGVILFAKHAEAHQHFSQLFEDRNVQKIYHALLHGAPNPPDGTIEAPIAPHSANNGTMLVHRRGKQAITDYRLLETYAGYALVEFEIHTGRTHQIRVHAKHLGHAVVADPLYGDGKPLLLSSFKRKMRLGKYAEEERPLMNRLALHALRLQFTGPDKKVYTVEAPYHKDFKATLQQLRKQSPQHS